MEVKDIASIEKIPEDEYERIVPIKKEKLAQYYRKIVGFTSQNHIIIYKNDDTLWDKAIDSDQEYNLNISFAKHVHTAVPFADGTLIGSNERIMFIRDVHNHYKYICNYTTNVHTLIPHTNGEDCGLIKRIHNEKEIEIFNIKKRTSKWKTHVNLEGHLYKGIWNTTDVFTVSGLLNKKTSYITYDIRDNKPLFLKQFEGKCTGRYPIANSPDGNNIAYLTTTAVHIFDMRYNQKPLHSIVFDNNNAKRWDIIWKKPQEIILHNRSSNYKYKILASNYYSLIENQENYIQKFNLDNYNELKNFYSQSIQECSSLNSYTLNGRLVGTFTSCPEAGDCFYNEKTIMRTGYGHRGRLYSLLYSLDIQ